jgi:hypothetical protein
MPAPRKCKIKVQPKLSLLHTALNNECENQLLLEFEFGSITALTFEKYTTFHNVALDCGICQHTLLSTF